MIFSGLKLLIFNVPDVKNEKYFVERCKGYRLSYTSFDSVWEGDGWSGFSSYHFK